MPPKSTRAATATQPSLKASFAAVRSAKGAAGLTEQKKKTFTPVVAVKPTAKPDLEPKRAVKRKKSFTDGESSDEDEPESPILETEDDLEVHVVQVLPQTDDEIVDVESEEEVKPKPKPKPKGRTSTGKTDKVIAKGATVATVHGENETKVEKMLRTFDLSYQYGPCVGVTRLERWKRAEALGLDPPIEVRDILLKGETEDTTESVFHRRV